MQIRKATREDIAEIDALLKQCSLPALPGGQPLSNLLVARGEDGVIGAVALEVVSRLGLVRSTVVADSHRRQGIGANLVSSIVARAHELGLRDLYLLTEDAADFFASRGFQPVARDEVPSEIRATREFSEECPESAQVMCMPLATRL